MVEVEPKVHELVEVRPGERIQIKDRTGEELIIQGVDDPDLISLAFAVDYFFVARQLDKSAEQVALARLQDAWININHRVQKEIGAMLA